MKKFKVLDKSIIEDFAVKANDDSAKRVYYLLSEYVDEIANKISQTNNLVNSQNVELVKVGDLFSNTFTNISELDLYLSIKSAQIEINSSLQFENKFRNVWKRIKYAWINRNKNSARFQKKQKKKLAKKNLIITEKDLLDKKEKPYTITDLKNDFFDGLVSNMTNTTILYNMPSKIRILGKDEFGFRINIVPVIQRDGFFKVLDTTNNKFIETNPVGAKNILDEKANEINKQNSILSIHDEDLLFKIIRIFKSLYYNLFQSYNYQFVESIVYYCPNSLFKIEDEKNYIYNVFLKVLNYINNINIFNIRSIYNQDKTILQQYNLSIMQIKAFLTNIKDYLL